MRCTLLALSLILCAPHANAAGAFVTTDESRQQQVADQQQQRQQAIDIGNLLRAQQETNSNLNTILSELKSQTTKLEEQNRLLTTANDTLKQQLEKLGSAPTPVTPSSQTPQVQLPYATQPAQPTPGTTSPGIIPQPRTGTVPAPSSGY